MRRFPRYFFNWIIDRSVDGFLELAYFGAA